MTEIGARRGYNESGAGARTFRASVTGMARGFESKSVESQQSEASYETRGRARESREDIERKQKRESLELSRSRITRELEAATSPVRRAALENALRYLDEELRRA